MTMYSWAVHIWRQDNPEIELAEHFYVDDNFVTFWRIVDGREETVTAFATGTVRRIINEGPVLAEEAGEA